jgi:hypothetical protein
MPSHPSLEGLREAAKAEMEACFQSRTVPYDEAWDRALQAQADYLRTHGVGWLGEGLVRVEQTTHNDPIYPGRWLYRLVPVPSEAGS